MKKYLLALLLSFQSLSVFADIDIEQPTIYYKVEIKDFNKVYLEGGIFSNKNDEGIVDLNMLSKEDVYNFCLSDKCVLANNTDGNISVIAIKINKAELNENEELEIDFNTFTSISNYSNALEQEPKEEVSSDVLTYKYEGSTKVSIGDQITLEIPPNKISNYMKVIITPFY